MLIAICDPSNEADQLQHWIRQYCTLYDIACQLVSFSDQDSFFADPASYEAAIVFMGLPGPGGFLAARRFKSEHPACRLVYVADTMEYCIQGVHLHFTDYILRPVQFKAVVRAMQLAGAVGTS